MQIGESGSGNKKGGYGKEQNISGNALTSEHPLSSLDF